MTSALTLLASCGGGGSGGNEPVDPGVPGGDSGARVRAIVAYRPATDGTVDESRIYTRIGAAGLSNSVERSLYYERYGDRPAPNCHDRPTLLTHWHTQTRNGRFVFVNGCDVPAVDKFDLLTPDIASTRLQPAPRPATPISAFFAHGPVLSWDETTVTWASSYQFTDPNLILFSFDLASNGELPARGLGSLFGPTPYWIETLRSVPGTRAFICHSDLSFGGGDGGWRFDTTVTPNIERQRLTNSGANIEPFRTGHLSQDGRFLRSADVETRRLAGGDYEIWGYDLTRPTLDIVLYTLDASSDQTLQRIMNFGDSSLLFVLVSNTQPVMETLVTARLSDGATRVVATHAGYGGASPVAGFVRGTEYLGVAGAVGNRAEVFAFDLAGAQPARRVTPSGGLAGVTAIASFGAQDVLVTHESGRSLALIRDTAPGVLEPIGGALTATQAYVGAMANPQGRIVVYSLSEGGRNSGPAYAVTVTAPTIARELPGLQSGEYALVRQVLDAG